MKALLLVAILSVGSFAWGIGRSGNGRVSDDKLGFSLSLPRSFDDETKLANGTLRMSERITSPFGLNFAPSLVEFRLASSELQELMTLSRADTREKLLALGYEIYVNADRCVDAYKKRSESATTIVVLWGPAKGLVILQPLGPAGSKAAEVAAQSLTLAAGACAWN